MGKSTHSPDIDEPFLFWPKKKWCNQNKNTRNLICTYYYGTIKEKIPEMRDHYNIGMPYSSNIVGTSLGKAAFNCVLVIRPTIWPKASTADKRTCKSIKKYKEAKLVSSVEAMNLPILILRLKWLIQEDNERSFSGRAICVHSVKNKYMRTLFFCSEEMSIDVIEVPVEFLIWHKSESV